MTKSYSGCCQKYMADEFQFTRHHLLCHRDLRVPSSEKFKMIVPCKIKIREKRNNAGKYLGYSRLKFNQNNAP